jgi:hypothetical protein
MRIVGSNFFDLSEDVNSKSIHSPIKTSIMKIITTRSKMDAKLLHARGKGHDIDKFKTIVKRAYKEVSDQDTALAYMKKNGGEWASYPYSSFLDPNTRNDEQLKDQFAAYLCGWLQYYDEIARNNAIDHTIYFDWQTDRVVVYIAPPPHKTGDPPITAPQAGMSSDPQDPDSPPPPYPQPSAT